MPRFALAAVVAACLLIIAVSALDVHCTALRPTSTSFVLACDAGRLSALAQGVQP
jgi:hypothetical protein